MVRLRMSRASLFTFWFVLLQNVNASSIKSSQGSRNEDEGRVSIITSVAVTTSEPSTSTTSNILANYQTPPIVANTEPQVSGVIAKVQGIVQAAAQSVTQPPITTTTDEIKRPDEEIHVQNEISDQLMLFHTKHEETTDGISISVYPGIFVHRPDIDQVPWPEIKGNTENPEVTDLTNSINEALSVANSTEMVDVTVQPQGHEHEHGSHEHQHGVHEQNNSHGGHEHEHGGHEHEHSGHHHAPLGTKGPDFSSPPEGNMGLEETRAPLENEIRQFVDFTNDVTFKLYSLLTAPSEKAGDSDNVGNVVFSPLAAISGLALLHLGAIGHTAEQLNRLLRLDDALPFNPHLLLKNITSDFLTWGLNNQDLDLSVGNAAAAVRAVFSDKRRGPLSDLYRLRAQTFHGGEVETLDFSQGYDGVTEEVKKRTDAFLKQQTKGRTGIQKTTQTGGLPQLKPPLAILTADVFQVSTNGRTDFQQWGPGQISFIHLPSLHHHHHRRLIHVPGFTHTSKTAFSGYDDGLDATAAELRLDDTLSLLLVMPGKPGKGYYANGEFAAGGLPRLEGSLSATRWSGLLRSLQKRELTVEAPTWQHQSPLRLRPALNHLGITDAFDPSRAKLKGLNNRLDLFLTDVVQVNQIAVDLLVGNETEIPNLDHSYPIVRFERPFLYILRHNPTGFVLLMGRYFNPPEDILKSQLGHHHKRF